MQSKDANTSASLVDASYELSDFTFETPTTGDVTLSNLKEIDFPKSRTVKFSDNKAVIVFSVDYEKLETQLKDFNSNK